MDVRSDENIETAQISLEIDALQQTSDQKDADDDNKQPSLLARALHLSYCPPRGRPGHLLSLALLPILLWLTSLAMFGALASPAPPQGPIFVLIVLASSAVCLGRLVALARLPPLLGMLVMGIALKNVPGLRTEEESWAIWSATLRGVALVIILLRAGLGLDHVALKKLSGMVFRLAFLPCLAEAVAVAVASNLILGFPWLWGFMLGFVLAAVSPAVIVPCLLELQEKGYGVAKGIPTLVIAAASIDDVLAISGFTILLGITFKPDAGLAELVLQGPIETLIGLTFGTIWGLLIIFLPGRDDQNLGTMRFILLLGGGLLALFGSKKIDVSGAGALAVLVMSCVSGIGWRRQGWTNDNVVASYLGKLWTVFEPILFGLIGMEIQFTKLDPPTIGWGSLVLLLGLSVRIAASFFSVMGGDLTVKERLFISLAWLPKATVQAAIGPVAFDHAIQMINPREDYKELGLQVLTIAVLVILITAPIGAVAIMLSGPKLLSTEHKPKDTENCKEMTVSKE